jgi:hypothetical protein
VRIALSLLLSAASALLAWRARAVPNAFDLEPGTRVLAPIVYRQLAVLPIVRADATSPATSGERFLTLADGLKSKEVTVAERAGGGDVNHVTVKNHSKQRLLLLGGQVILGGQQDRIIGKDTILAPGETASLEVFCVEHGRWSGHAAFDAAGGMAEGKTRERAKFEGSQGRVWAQVASKTAALGAASPTGTYRRLATGDAGRKAATPYHEAIAAALARLPEAKRMVGYVAAVNGRVTAVEKFASPELFAAYRDQLLDALYIAVADVPVAPASAPPDADAVRAFVKGVDNSPEERVLDNAASTTVHAKGRSVVNSKVLAKPLRPREGTAGAAASPAPVYESFQAAE